MDTKSHKIAGVGVLVALAMVLSYLESLIPISLGIPGIKLGLSNVVTLFALYQFGGGIAFGVSAVLYYVGSLLAVCLRCCIALRGDYLVLQLCLF